MAEPSSGSVEMSAYADVLAQVPLRLPEPDSECPHGPCPASRTHRPTPDWS